MIRTFDFWSQFKFAAIIALAIGCFGEWIHAESPVAKNLPSISFSYAGSNNEKIPKNNRDNTEYHFGKVMLSGSEFYQLDYLVSSAADKLSPMELSMIESVSMNDGVLEARGSTFLENFELETPNLLLDSVATLNFSATVTHSFQKLKPTNNPAFLKPMGSFRFLGQLRDVSLMKAIAGESLSGEVEHDRSTYRFQVDLETNFIVELRAKHAAEPQKPIPRHDPSATLSFEQLVELSEAKSRNLGGISLATFISDSSGGWRWKSHSESTFSDIGKHILSYENLITDLSNDVAWPPILKYPPSEGDKIVLMDSQQIDAIWHDDGIARAYDGGIAEELATVKFRRSSNQWWLWISCLALLAAPLILWRCTKQGAKQK